MVRYANIIKISIFGLSGAKIGPPQLRFSCPALCHSEVLSLCHSEEPSPLCHSEEVARPTKNLIQSHSERSKESISTLNFCEQLAVSFFSRTFLCKKVPKSFCTVKMAAFVFTRSLSGHGRLTLFRTPAPGARSLDGRNPAISTSAGFRKNHSRARPGRSRNVSSRHFEPLSSFFSQKAPLFFNFSEDESSV